MTPRPWGPAPEGVAVAPYRERPDALSAIPKRWLGFVPRASASFQMTFAVGFRAPRSTSDTYVRWTFAL